MASEFMIATAQGQKQAALQLIKGDITRIKVDAIVNAANAELAGGGGVDGAIHRAGGPTLMSELDTIRRKIGRCETGNVVATNAGQLPAQFVFHAVGPIYRGGQSNEERLLSSCYETSLELASEHGLASISFPSISTGVYGYPIEAGAAVAISAVDLWLRTHNGTIQTVKLVQFSDRDHKIYLDQAARIFEK